MKKAILLLLFTFHFSLCGFAAKADLVYVAQRVEDVDPKNAKERGREDLSRDRRYYLGGDFSYSFWQSEKQNGFDIDGRGNTGFDLMAGIRVYDTFRLEANYANTAAKYRGFSVSENIVMVNAIWDARIDYLYRWFHRQYVMPYAGFGVGLAFNDASGGAEIRRETSIAANAMVGLGIEFNEWFALDFGYRYLYVSSPELKISGVKISSFAPSAHQLRAGVRVSF
ncbi:MAG: outer membrane beta-barrel protein [Rickettsiales bacterium]|jgi:opacity protein-like surface antigen|nr:outer membrane beta-barrel protein [Rickettsiales bacterium]